jgi:hypothetical protein
MMFQNQYFKKRNTEVLFKENHTNKINLDLRNIILLDNQSTIDLFCNPKLVTHITEQDKNLKLQSSSGTMTVHHKAKMQGYKKDVWFSKNAITNIIALRNLIKQYRVTYDSDDNKTFVVHRSDQPNMELKMNACGLHYYNPTDKTLVFVATVSSKKEGYTQRQIEGAEVARSLYAKLGYPSTKDYKWMLMLPTQSGARA